MPARLISLSLLTTAALYARGLFSLWSRGRRRGVRLWEVGCFCAGTITLALALLSPLHAASEHLFSAHMIQHELLMVVAAPLLVIGKPMFVMLWSLPVRARRSLGQAVRKPWCRVAWRALARPLDAWFIHAAVIWCWHVPLLFQAALSNEFAHGLQHISFLGSAVVFWWAIIHPRQRAALGISIMYLFTTAVHTALLGALITFVRTPWYPAYGSGAATWGLSALQDQQLAGMIMWIPASLVYLGAALIIMRRWLHHSEWTAAHAERVTYA